MTGNPSLEAAERALRLEGRALPPLCSITNKVEVNRFAWERERENLNIFESRWPALIRQTRLKRYSLSKQKMENPDDLLQKTSNWYTDAENYWQGIEPTVEGMLGGYGSLDLIDAGSSSRFIQEFISKGSLGTQQAADCGAGIGRVSKSFLLKHFEKVEMVEQTSKFLEQARLEFASLGLIDKVSFINSGLQDFTPQAKKYQLIWCQWVLSHLTDDDLVAFLKRCKAAEPCFIGIKENVAQEITLYDKVDSSCTRPDAKWKEIFERASLKLVKEANQTAFPNNLFPVKMYLLQ